MKPFQARQDPSHIFAEEEEEEEEEKEESDKDDGVDGPEEIGDESTRTITKVYEEVCVNSDFLLID